MLFRSDQEDAGIHALSFGWVGPGGDEIWSSSGEVEVGTPPPGAFELDIPVIASIDLPIQQPGTHTMRIELDGEVRSELYLHVRLGTPAPPAHGLVS